MNNGEVIYIVLEKLSETIGDGIYSGEEIRRHIMKQAKYLKELADICNL